MKYESTQTTATDHHLTSEFHVGHDHFFTNASEYVLVLKQMLVVWPFTHRCQELDGIAYKLEQKGGYLLLENMSTAKQNDAAKHTP